MVGGDDMEFDLIFRALLSTAFTGIQASIFSWPHFTGYPCRAFPRLMLRTPGCMLWGILRAPERTDQIGTDFWVDSNPIQINGLAHIKELSRLKVVIDSIQFIGLPTFDYLYYGGQRTL